MNNENIGGLTASGASWIFAALQPNELLQYVQLILSIVATLVSVIISLYCWAKRAKADGKITKDEIDEAIDIMDDARKGIEENIKKIDNKEKEEKNGKD